MKTVRSARPGTTLSKSIIGLAAAAMLLVAGCGSSSEPEEPAGAGSAADTAAPPAAESDPASDGGSETAPESEPGTPAESGTPESSGPAESGSAAPGSGDSSPASLLPDEIKSAGKVRVASTIGYPPEQFYDTDGTTPIGFSVEIGHGLGEILGVDFEFMNTGFSSILPGLQAGRYDVAISSMSVTPERNEVVNFVEYLDAGATLLVPAANPHNVNGLIDICGLKAAMVQGSIQADTLAEFNKTDCEPQGKPDIEIVTFADSDGAYQALSAGRVDATFRDFTAQAYAAQQSEGQLTVVGDIVSNAPYGIAVPKDQLQLAKAIQAALQQMMDDGSYLEILEKWDVDQGAITTAKLLEATG